MVNSAPVTNAELVRQQIDAHVRDFVRFAEAMQRNLLLHARLHIRGVRHLTEQFVRHRPLDEGRMHRVTAHLRAQARAVQRDRLGKQPHTALRGVVGREIVPTDDAGHRRDVHDRSAAALEQRETVLAAEERAVEIDRHHLAPRRVVGCLNGAKRRDAGGIHKAVEPPRARTDRLNDALPVAFRRHIERVIDAGTIGQVGRDRDPAVAHDRLGDRRADAAGRAGDEDDLVAQAAH